MHFWSQEGSLFSYLHTIAARKENIAGSHEFFFWDQKVTNIFYSIRKNKTTFAGATHRNAFLRKHTHMSFLYDSQTNDERKREREKEKTVSVFSIFLLEVRVDLCRAMEEKREEEK